MFSVMYTWKPDRQLIREDYLQQEVSYSAIGRFWWFLQDRADRSAGSEVVEEVASVEGCEQGLHLPC